ncbi:MAG: hypothetical protein JXB04_04790 [Kiritimatiellae bacterium]|nr:hypothetical protein [Kiritimatiellia bacterium]
MAKEACAIVSGRPDTTAGRRAVSVAVVLAAVMGCCGGCTPATDAEREYLEARREKARQKEAFLDAVEVADESGTAIQLVKDSPAPDGQGTAEAWANRETGQVRGSVLFPRWTARRRGRGKYEVHFTYTLMDETGSVSKHGHAWSVDIVLRLVGSHRLMTAEELNVRTRGSARRRSGGLGELTAPVETE